MARGENHRQKPTRTRQEPTDQSRHRLTNNISRTDRPICLVGRSPSPNPSLSTLRRVSLCDYGQQLQQHQPRGTAGSPHLHRRETRRPDDCLRPRLAGRPCSLGQTGDACMHERIECARELWPHFPGRHVERLPLSTPCLDQATTAVDIHCCGHS